MASGAAGVVGFCPGCWQSARLMDWGLVSETTCEVCRLPPAPQTVSR